MRILVAEDTPVNAILLKNILEHAGHSVIVAKDGVEALEALEKNPGIGLAAVDVHMPRMGGLELVREIRKRPEVAELPVIFITAAAEASVVREAVALKSVGYILKPIVEPSRVLERVQAAVATTRLVLVEQEVTGRLLGISVRAYRGMLDEFTHQLIEVREKIAGSIALGDDLQRLAESADQLGAQRLLHQIEGGGSSSEGSSLVREIDALIAEMAERGVGKAAECLELIQA